MQQTLYTIRRIFRKSTMTELDRAIGEVVN